jgi:ABC-type ATPase involved in cell division
LADEPTGNLDSKNGESVMELLADLHQTGDDLHGHARRALHKVCAAQRAFVRRQNRRLIENSCSIDHDATQRINPS